MTTMYFRCILKTDVVLNQRAATEGNQECLDFIPGNNFLGIVAGNLYNGDTLNASDCIKVFHSGGVRFGDAHPEKDGKRALRVPASMYKPKLTETERLYIHHEINKKEIQLKQCRTGFYLFENLQMEELKVKKSFAIKSAYDRNLRRSADEKMYGYESLDSGSSWLFEVSMDHDDLKYQILEALIGVKKIGRSRTAQYGLIEINEATDYKETIQSRYLNNEYVFVYADSRLIFLDDFGLPNYQPTAYDFGFEGCEIDWDKSQIRTFQYAPWNFKRQARDADRCGMEKGSVICIKKIGDELKYPKTPFVGEYKNEGFGKVIFNPAFLEVLPDTNGLSKYKIEEDEEDKADSLSEILSGKELLTYLRAQNTKSETEQRILEKVNAFVSMNKSKYTIEAFSSQWGTIRSISNQYKTRQNILYQLFEKEENGKSTAYLTHGVAKDRWEENRRKEDFETFIRGFSDEDFQLAIINLATEMAKISKGGKLRWQIE